MKNKLHEGALAVHLKKRMLAVFAAGTALAVIGGASGCAGNTLKVSSDEAWQNYQGHSFPYFKAEKYTKADYELMTALNTDGYKNMSVREFNKKAMDWENEDSYHKAEEAMARLVSSLPEDDKNRDFIFNTMENTWRECEKKHYNQCEKEASAWYSASAVYEKYGDVYGENERLIGCYADFSFNYTISDESALTVGQRDENLLKIKETLEAAIEGQTDAVRTNEEKMEKTLTDTLKAALKNMDEKIVWGEKCSVSYSYDAPYAPDEEAMSADSSDKAVSSLICAEGTAGTSIDSSTSLNVDASAGYTKEQYKQVIDVLLPKDYEKMSVAQFDRAVHKAFAESSWDEDSIAYAYENVSAWLPENDPNFYGINELIPRAAGEYNARAASVYRGENVYPQVSVYEDISLEEDVYGDKVVVGNIIAEYTFSYDILDADRLTVAEREDFLHEVKNGVKRFLTDTAKEGKISRSEFEAGIEAAGKAAGNDKIQFIRCGNCLAELY